MTTRTLIATPDPDEPEPPFNRGGLVDVGPILAVNTTGTTETIIVWTIP